jgi:hypothetical protein
MGNLATPEALLARWDELCRDPSLRDLPYKIELNGWGKIEMTQLTNRRGILVASLACELNRQLRSGVALISCGVLTSMGVSVADAAWASHELMDMYKDAMLFERAPEICAEVCTPDGEEKVAAYLAAGAREVWLVSEDGSIRYFDASGEREKSDFPLTVFLQPPMKI